MIEPPEKDLNMIKQEIESVENKCSDCDFKEMVKSLELQPLQTDPIALLENLGISLYVNSSGQIQIDFGQCLTQYGIKVCKCGNKVYIQSNQPPIWLNHRQRYEANYGKRIGKNKLDEIQNDHSQDEISSLENKT